MLVLERQRHDEGRAVPGRAVHAHAAAHELDELARDPQAEPEAAVVALRRGALELAEDALLLLGRHADAVIDYADLGAPVVAAELDLDRLALPVLDGVGDEVGDDLIDARAIPEPQDRRRRRQLERDVLPPRFVLEPRDHLFGDVDEIDALEL